MAMILQYETPQNSPSWQPSASKRLYTNGSRVLAWTPTRRNPILPINQERKCLAGRGYYPQTRHTKLPAGYKAGPQAHMEATHRSHQRVSHQQTVSLENKQANERTNKQTSKASERASKQRKEKKRKKERERETERERERKTDRQTDRQKERKKERKKQTNKQTNARLFRIK